ncbi:MAG: SurA N-terminal domain-containing protein [Fretibacterium sp.]|nr:SurA N-terminal domain-containing protein [Fretibacterium sp.]
MMKRLRQQMKWIMIVIVVAFLLSTFLMYEGRSSRGPRRNADGTMADYEVASINGRILMRSELERLLRGTLERMNQRSLVSVDVPALYQSILDQYVLEVQTEREVSDRGIEVSDAEAELAMKEYADTYFPTREAFYQALQMSGIKVEDYKKDVARQMAVQQLYRMELGEVVASEDQALNFYDVMKNIFYRTPEGFMVHFADFKSSADAEALHSRLAALEGPVTSADWMLAISDDRLSSRDIANVTKEPMFLPVSAFRGAFSPMASLDVGQVSPVFSMSSDDFALGLKTEHRQESVRSYDEVSGDIRVMLREQELQQRTTDFQRRLRENAEVEIYDTSLFPKPVSEDKKATAPATVNEKAAAPASADEKAEAPASVNEKAAAPASADEKAEAPVPVNEKAAVPASADEKAEAPASVNEKTAAPTSADEKAAAPAPADEKAAAPASADEKAEAPVPVNEKTAAPASADEKAAAPAPADEKAVAPASADAAQ